MKNYIVLDSDGYVICSGYGADIPDGSIEADIDFSNQPSPSHKFHFDTQTWIDCTPEKFFEQQIRSKRNNLLVDSDWTQLSDVPEQTRLKWQSYRQALRDITLQDGFPENIIWPTKPE